MEKKEFIEKAKRQIDELFDKIDALEAKSYSIKADVKVKYNEQLNSLRAKKEGLISKYDDLDSATDEKWEETKNAFSSASDSFKEGFSKLASLF